MTKVCLKASFFPLRVSVFGYLKNDSYLQYLTNIQVSQVLLRWSNVNRLRFDQILINFPMVKRYPKSMQSNLSRSTNLLLRLG